MTPRGRLARLPPAVVIGAFVVLGALLSWRHTRHVHEWVVMTDELQYLDLARSFGDGSFPLPTLRGQHAALLSVLYSLLIAPVVALSSAPDAYQDIHAVNALLVSSTAIPVYLLARELVAGRWPAYLAAALAVAVPWAATSGVVMTEAAAYPAFAWALLGIQRALVAPSLRRDLVALAGIGLAFFARTQFVFLTAAFPAVIVLHEVLYAATARTQAPDRAAKLRLLRERLRPHAALAALIAIGYVVVFPLGALSTVLGPFSGTVHEGGVLQAGLGSAMRMQLTFVAGGVGILPLALAVGWALASLVRPLDRRSHAFATLAIVVSAALTYVVAVFGLRHAAGPLDRYMFYIAPLLIVGTVACLAQGRARPLGLAAGAAFAFWLLRTPGVEFVDPGGINVNSQASEFHRLVQGQVGRLRSALGMNELTPVSLLSWGTLVASAAVSLLLRRAPRFALAAVGLPLLALAIAQTDYVSKRLTMYLNTTNGDINPVPLAQRDWIDEALPRGGDVALATSLISDVQTSRLVWWNVEFWNKRVNRALIFSGFEDVAPFPSQRMSLNRRSGSIRTSDGQEPRFIVFARNQLVFRPRGRFLAQYRTSLQADPGLELIEPERPYRAAWIVDGVTPDGWIVRGTPARVRVFPRDDDRPQRLSLSLDLPVNLVAASPFEVRVGGRVVRGQVFPGTINGDTKLTVCIPPRRLRVARVITDAVRPLPDGRKVGVHLRSIRVQPDGGDC